MQFFYTSLMRAGAFAGFDCGYIALDSESESAARLLAPLEGAPTKFFKEGPPGNTYLNLRKLSRCLPPEPGLVFTNYPLELACLDQFRRADLTIVHVCHDEFYVGVALQYQHIIDVFVAHNPHFVAELQRRLPAERRADVRFLPFGIHQFPEIVRTPRPAEPLRAVFIGRFDKRKGLLQLPEIDQAVRAQGCAVNWSVLGCGPARAELETAIGSRQNFHIESPPDARSMLALAAAGDVFILPTQLDGTPLALMEAMSVGLVPIVPEFNPGVHWMVPENAGFVCANEPAAMAALIVRLSRDRTELEERSAAARTQARAEFDASKGVSGYAGLIANWARLKKTPSRSAYRLNRLDKKWIPNAVVIGLRRAFRTPLFQTATRRAAGIKASK